MKTWICPNCCQEISEGATQCEHCKAEIERKIPAPSPEQRPSRLARAGVWLAAGALYCVVLSLSISWATDARSTPFLQLMESLFAFFLIAFLLLSVTGAILNFSLIIWYIVAKKPLDCRKAVIGLIFNAILLLLAAILLLPALGKARESLRTGGSSAFGGAKPLEMVGLVDEVWIIERSSEAKTIGETRQDERPRAPIPDCE